MAHPLADIPAHRPPFRQAVDADLQRIYGPVRARSLLRAWLQDRTFRPVFTLRLCQASFGLTGWWGRLAHAACKLLHRWAQHQACMDLPWNVSVGMGLRIVHGWGLVVTPGARIGSNATLFHGATIGRKDDIEPDGRRTSEFPVIEDSVWIGPQAVVVGGVKLHSGCRVAAGTVVTGDVPQAAIVGGNPMRILRTDAIPDVLHPAVLA